MAMASSLREQAGRKKVLQGELITHARILSFRQTIAFVSVDVEVEEMGRRVTLHVANVALTDTPIAEVQSMYPQGAQISIRGPRIDHAGCSSYVEHHERDAPFIMFLQDPSLLEVRSYFSKKAMELYQSMDAVQLRKQGNIMFGKQHYHSAIQLYAMSINKASPEDKESLLFAHSNRAECYLLLSMWKDAHDDCCKALQLDPLHDKSLFRQGKALHHMQEYHRACMVLGEVAKRNPESTDIQAALKKSQIFLAQSTTGDYSKCLEDYIMNGNSWDEAPECSDYLGPVEIRLMVCNAMAMARQRNCLKTDVPLKVYVLTKLVRLCMKSKEHLRQLYTLADSEESCRTDVPPMCLFGPEKTMRGGGLLLQGHDDDGVDAERISRIVDITSYTLSMTLGRAGRQCRYSFFTGQWVLPAFINNSCIYNMSKIEVGEAAFFHASRDVKAGEELTVHYIDIYQPWSTYRRKRFLDYKFECRCMRCIVESAYEGKLKHVDDAMAALGNRIFDDNDEVAQVALARLALDVEGAIQDASEEEKSMFRTSHINVYTSYYKLAKKQLGAGISTDNVPPAEVLVRSLRLCAPGDLKTIQLIAMLIGEVRASDYWAFIGYDTGVPRVLSELRRQVHEGTWSWMKLL